MNGLDPTIVVAAIAVVGVLATAGGTLFGAVLSRGTETRKLLVGAPVGYSQLVDDLQQERDRDRTLLQALDAEVASMRSRMRGLEAGEDSNRKLIEILREHIIELRGALRRAGIVPPPIPAGSGIEDSGPLPAVVSTTVTTSTSTTS